MKNNVVLALTLFSATAAFAGDDMHTISEKLNALVLTAEEDREETVSVPLAHLHVADETMQEEDNTTGNQTVNDALMAADESSDDESSDGTSPSQGLIHRHISFLYTYACAQLPPEEEVFTAQPTLPPSIMAPAYATKKLLTEAFQPWQWEKRTFENADHFWHTVRKTPQGDFPELHRFIENEDCSRSFVHHTKAPHNKALIVASAWGLIKEVRKHLDSSADVHTEDDSALGFAARNGRTNCVALLLERGADIHADNDYALQRACYHGQKETVHYLLEQGADKTAGEDNKDALYWAVRGGQTALLPLLINSGDQETLNRALMVAVEWNHREVVESLSANGADLHAEEDAPFRRACECGHTELAHFLLSHGANIHAVHDDAFLNAAKNGHAETVQFLLDQHRITGQGEIPYEYINQAFIDTVNGSKEINDPTNHIATLNILLAAGADIHAYNNGAIRNARDNGNDAIINFLCANNTGY